MKLFLHNFNCYKKILLAEDVGFHVGDGHMGIYPNRKGVRYDFTYSGDAEKDKDYFIKF